MKGDKVNDKNELFCQLILQGKSQRQAYLEAFPSSRKWKSATVDVKACVLANSDKILERLEFLRNEARQQMAITRNDVIEQIKEIGFFSVDLDAIKPMDKIKALELMCKILGFDKPEYDVKTAGPLVVDDSEGAVNLGADQGEDG